MGRRTRHLAAALVCLALLGPVALPAPAEPSPQPTADVLHWWTAGGEAKALKVIADAFEAQGGRWIDDPVAGGGGDAARTVAKTRILGGRPPTLMQWHLGLSLQQLAQAGLLGDVDEVASAGHWTEVLPPLIADNARFHGRYVAIPLDIHGENWLWSNPKVLAAAGVGVPRSWDEFNAAAVKLRAAGYIPLAVGGQAWQQVILFSDVLLGLGGAPFYRQALVALDPEALSSATMVEVFAELSRIKAMIDPGSGNRDWNETTRLVIDGKAAMQLMGDWAKGEFAAAGLEPERDFGCSLAPGAAHAYVVAADALAVPKVADPAQRAGQLLAAATAMDPRVQRDFNLAKGSIPPRRDIAPDGFDVCARQAMAMTRGDAEVLPAIGSSMGIGGAEAGAIADAISLFFARNLSPEAGARALSDALDATR